MSESSIIPVLQGKKWVALDGHLAASQAGGNKRKRLLLCAAAGEV